MYSISAKQIRMARASLDWSQEDLARRTGLASSTIGNLESGFVPRGKTADIIQRTFEKEGLEFISNEGVRHCITDIGYYYGPESCTRFFDDLMQAAKADNCEVFAYVFSQDMLARSCGGVTGEDLSRLERLNRFANVKCLVPETEDIRLPLSQFEFRFISRDEVGPEQFYVYGNNYAIVLEDGAEACRFVVFQSVSMAHARRKYFRVLWDNSLPQIMPLRRPRSEAAEE